jgi:hypothetical protein
MLHAQEKLPAVLVQVALPLQVSRFSAHSSMSEQVTPLPVQPTLQAHVKLPVVLVHVACTAHVSAPSTHSSTSAHHTPLPV